MDNISAISTSLAPSGVAVIRISGDSPLDVADKMFRAFNGTKVADFVPNMMYVGEIDGVGFKDTGLIVYFKAPKSYTGEDTVEIHCHGGIAIAKGILEKTLQCGARLATNGEFTKRAFLNGKMSLSSAEGLIDMINSESVGEVKAGYYLYRENLKNKVDKMQQILTDVLAKIDANIDFPEEDLEEGTSSDVKEDITGVLQGVDELLSQYNVGRKIKNGIKVAICGKPNTGKSRLLNAMLAYNKAIVSSVAGTTRDIVEGDIDIKGIKFYFYDTAGIHYSDDEIEKMGIDMAKKSITSSDIVLFVLDSSTELTIEDQNLYSEIKDKKHIVVYNKSDIKKDFTCSIKADIAVSAKTGDKVSELKELIYSRSTDGGIDLNGDFLTEERHFIALKNAKAKLQNVIDCADKYPSDVLAIDVKDAWSYLGEISGKTANEEIINTIFSKFCVGK